MWLVLKTQAQEYPAILALIASSSHRSIQLENLFKGSCHPCKFRDHITSLLLLKPNTGCKI
jgi:hypothetical protein